MLILLDSASRLLTASSLAYCKMEVITQLLPSEIEFRKQLSSSRFSAVFEVNVRGLTCVLKVVSGELERSSNLVI